MYDYINFAFYCLNFILGEKMPLERTDDKRLTISFLSLVYLDTFQHRYIV